MSREDGSARTAVLARLKKQADGECLTISQFSMEEYVLQLLRHDGVASVYESFTELRKRPAMGVLIVDRLRGAKLIDYLQQKDGAKLERGRGAGDHGATGVGVEAPRRLRGDVWEFGFSTRWRLGTKIAWK